ncbi:hypothetical protein [Pseudoclavibacter helvolus]|uniref:hypothetical protein n=1 Tax=Pseudoclavibacter helvolus TaxID=255205 RepID=UPI000837DD45|nr:hypothetical protein [Pseudoclavibacter helvolus]
MSSSDPELLELSQRISQLDRRYGTNDNVLPMQVMLAVIAANADVDRATLRRACRRSGSPRIAKIASSKSSWSQALRLSSQHSSAFLHPGEVAGAEARDAAAVAVGRRLVGHLLAAQPPALSTRLGPVTRHALAVVAGRELEEARSKGWSGVIMTGPWLSIELGLSSPQSGKKALDRLVELRWLSKGRRARSGRARVYKAARLTSAEGQDLFEQHAATVDALTTGTRGQSVLADLVLTARAAAWTYGQDAPGTPVWAYAVEQTSGCPLGLTPRSRAAARAWLSSRGLSVPELVAWVEQRSRPGTVAATEKEVAERARAEKALALAEVSSEHAARVKLVGGHLRDVARQAVKHPGKRKSFQAFVPGPEQGAEAAQEWFTRVRAALVARGLDEAAMAEADKQMLKAFEAAGNVYLTGGLNAQRARVEAAQKHLVTAARAAVDAPGRRSTLAALVPPLDAGQEALRAWVLRLQYGLIVAAIDPTLLGQVGVQLERALVDAGYPEKASSGIPRGLVADLRRRGTDIPQSQAA